MTYTNYDRIPIELTQEKMKHIKILTDDLQIQCIHQKNRGELLDRIKNLLHELSFLEQEVILYGMEPVQKK